MIRQPIRSLSPLLWNLSSNQNVLKMLCSNVKIVQSKSFNDPLVHNKLNCHYRFVNFVPFDYLFLPCFNCFSRPIPLTISLVPCGGIGRYLLFCVVCLSDCLCPCVYIFNFIMVCPCNFYFHEYIKKKFKKIPIVKFFLLGMQQLQFLETISIEK